MHDVYVALGGNLGDPLACFAMVVKQFQEVGMIRRCSGIYLTAPQGGPAQPDYLNAVFSLETMQSGEDLLHLGLAAEQACGRLRTVPWGPRPLDVDLLLYDDRIIKTPDLILPHPRMHLRRFVLEPLREIAPIIYIPGRGFVESLLRQVASQRVTRLHDWPA